MKSPLALLLVLPLMTLMGCAQTTGFVETKPKPAPILVGPSKQEICSQWKGVGWSSKDTDQTIRDVKANNARQQAWCKQ
jgi:hypothetical protein